MTESSNSSPLFVSEWDEGNTRAYYESLSATEIGVLIEEKARDYLLDLGLSFGDILGKRVLEVGAGLSPLMFSKKLEHADITFLESSPERWKDAAHRLEWHAQQKLIPHSHPYVTGNVMSLPFENNSFDLVIAHSAPPSVGSETREEVRVAMDNVLRVLRTQGGEFRIYPASLGSNLFSGETLLTPKEIASDRNGTLRLQTRGARSLALLREMYPRIQRRLNSSSNITLPMSAYFTIRK